MKILKMSLLVLIVALFVSAISPTDEVIPFYEGVSVSELSRGESGDSAAIYLLKDSLQDPLCYYSDIFSPVCFDNSCRAVSLRIYWDLCGEFLGFKVAADDPLTKNRHEPFSKQDYYTLYTILNNPNAPISKMDKQDLVNHNSVSGADAVSGATTRGVSAFVVAGAAYSTYMLWHLVYGGSKVHDVIENQPEMVARFDSLASLSTIELTHLLYDAHNDKMLKRYAIQKKLVADLNSLSALNSLLISNYLSRQSYLSDDVVVSLRRCGSIDKAFERMLPTAN